MVRYHNSGTQKFDDTEHDSVNTDKSNITSPGLGTTKILQETREDSDTFVGEYAQFTEAVGTSPVVILSAEDTTIGNLIHVSGSQNGFPRFTDIILFARGGSVERVASSTNGSAPTRTYSNPAESTLELELGSVTEGEANVAAYMIGAGRGGV